MGKQDDAIRRSIEGAFAEQWAATAVERKVAADAFDNHQALLTRIGEQRALRLARAPKDKPRM